MGGSNLCGGMYREALDGNWAGRIPNSAWKAKRPEPSATADQADLGAMAGKRIGLRILPLEALVTKMSGLVYRNVACTLGGDLGRTIFIRDLETDEAMRIGELPPELDGCEVGYGGVVDYIVGEPAAVAPIRDLMAQKERLEEQILQAMDA